jgi:hypothetical protein
MMKSADDILYEISMYGFSNGVEGLNIYQRHLFYFDEFLILVANGGGSGFIFNRSPVSSGETEHEVYIESFRFFGFVEIANDLEKYYVDYLDVVKKWIKNSKPDFEEMISRTDLEERRDTLSIRLEKLSREPENVYKWMNENLDKINLFN